MVTGQMVRQLVAKQVAAEIKKYLHSPDDRPQRKCVTCGTMFTPRMRFHFFDSPDCRRDWYRGWFHPRKRD